MSGKIFNIPLIDKYVVFYYGESSYDTFKKDVIRFNEVIRDFGNTKLSEISGETYGSYFWIKDINDYNTLFHEIQHILENMYFTLGCTCETEFKAYLAGYVCNEILQYIFKLKDTKNGNCKTVCKKD